MAYDMRLLHIIGSMDPLSGGPCQGIRSSSPALEKLDVYREVVCFDNPDAAFVGTDSFPVHPLGKGKSLWQYNHKLIPWLRENLHRFDVVITNGLWLYHSNAIRRVITEIEKNNLNKNDNNKKWLKWFIMPHGMLDPYFQIASSRKIKAIRNWFYWKLLEHKVVSQADGLLFTCETELLLAREAFKPYHPKREVNVGYGIESPPDYSEVMRQAFLKNCPGLADKPYLLFLSRIHPKKGVDLLLKAYTAFSTLSNDKTSLPKLVIAGPGIDSDFGQSMRQLANKDPAIWANIYFTGMLTGAAKWGAFYGCEAFILPSHQENFGIAVAEALACAKPVLISNQVNIWREIEASAGGIVAENNLVGVEQLLHKWQEMTSDAKKEMSEKAKDTYEQYFSVCPAAIRFKKAIS